SLDIWRERVSAEKARFAHRIGGAAAERRSARKCPPLFAFDSRRIPERRERTSMKARRSRKTRQSMAARRLQFCVVSVALLTLFLLIDVGAWIFVAPSTAGVRASPMMGVDRDGLGEKFTDG